LAALNTSQKAVNWSDTANFRPLGVAKEMYDNTGGADNAVIGEFYREGRFEFVASGANSSWLGSLVYATDNQTVQTTATTNMPAIGRVVEVISATRVVVDVHLR
jgi:predicted RecA/RadA family phage recombinase